MCSLLDLVNPPEDPLDPVEDCSEEEETALAVLDAGAYLDRCAQVSNEKKTLVV